MASQLTSWEEFWEKSDIMERLANAEKMLRQLSETFLMVARSVHELVEIIERTEGRSGS